MNGLRFTMSNFGDIALPRAANHAICRICSHVTGKANVRRHHATMRETVAKMGEVNVHVQ